MDTYALRVGSHCSQSAPGAARVDVQQHLLQKLVGEFELVREPGTLECARGRDTVLRLHFCEHRHSSSRHLRLVSHLVHQLLAVEQPSNDCCSLRALEIRNELLEVHQVIVNDPVPGSHSMRCTTRQRASLLLEKQRVRDHVDERPGNPDSSKVAGKTNKEQTVGCSVRPALIGIQVGMVDDDKHSFWRVRIRCFIQA